MPKNKSFKIDLRFKENRAVLFRVASDTSLETADQLRYIYHWVMYHQHNAALAKSLARRSKHAKKLNELKQIFNFQHQLTHL